MYSVRCCQHIILFRRIRKQILDDLHSVEKSLCKRLCTCRKADGGVNEFYGIWNGSKIAQLV